LNDALYCLRFLLMILLLVEMMNQSLGTCPNFGVHFSHQLWHSNSQSIPSFQSIEFFGELAKSVSAAIESAVASGQR